MRKKLLVISGLFALVGTIAVAAVLGTAGIGKAASPNICITASTSTTNASCVAELTAPHVLTAGKDAVSVTRFTNQSGLGGATATHVVLSATFLDCAVTVKGVTLFVNGSPVSTASCSPAPLAHSGRHRVMPGWDDRRREFREAGGSFFRPRPPGPWLEALRTARAEMTALRRVRTARKTTCRPLGTRSRSLGTSAQGDCVATPSLPSLAPPPRRSRRPRSARSIRRSICRALRRGAGVDAVGTRPTGFVHHLVHGFPGRSTAGGFATVTLDALFNVPKSFVLQELTGPNPTDPASWTAVPACNASGLPPSGDSCIFSTSNLPKGGVRWILHAFGTLFDSKYAG